jgi:hypothetical protein
MMGIKQALLDAGINAFAADLLAESYLRSGLAQPLAEKGKTLQFFLPVNRSDCPTWKGVEISIKAVAK